MPATEMMTVMAVALFLLLGFVYFLRLIQAWMLHRTVRDAIKRDSAHAGPLLDRIGRGDLSGPSVAEGSDDRTGMVLIALALALAGFSFIVGDPEWLRYGLGGALFPGLVGAALLLRHRLQRQVAEPDVATGA
jgi:hypothetical protein